MLTKLRIFVIGAVALAGIVSTPARAAPKLKPGDLVHIQGCVTMGVEGMKCPMVKTGGVTFDVSAVGLKVGVFAQGKATVSGKVSVCQQGVLVENFVPEKVDHPLACGAAK